MTSARESLERERAGYVLRGLDDRVAQVDAELAKLASASPEIVTADEAQADVETADEPTAKARRRK